jgi:hypothetical protein
LGLARVATVLAVARPVGVVEVDKALRAHAVFCQADTSPTWSFSTICGVQTNGPAAFVTAHFISAAATSALTSSCLLVGVASKLGKGGLWRRWVFEWRGS